MGTKTIIGLGLGGALIYGIYRFTRNNDNRQIHISQTQTANNAGYVIYNQKYYAIEEVLSYTQDINVSAYQAQQEIAANSKMGQVLTLSINQIDRSKLEVEVGERFVNDGM